MVKYNVENSERTDWKKLIGKRKTFRGKIARFGHKHRQGEKIFRGATIALIDVHLKGSNKVIDHVWIDYTPEFARYGEYLIPYTEIEFEADVTTYEKGGKHSYENKVTGTFLDIQLSNAKIIKIVHTPHVTNKYDKLIDDSLTSYVITRRENTKSGVLIGEDPYGVLGKIYIGQGFANKLAKHLSWRWLNELPEKNRYKAL